MKSNTPVLLSYAFRPFFLFNGIFAILIVLAWLMTLHGSGLPFATPLWHSHEMLIGFALAAVAGFSLTAVANWTGRPALKGTPLAGLVLFWLAGRFAMIMSFSLPAGLVFVLDSLFPILLTLLLGREIISGQSKRNYPLIVIMVTVVILNVFYHLGATLVLPGADRTAIYLAEASGFSAGFLGECIQSQHLHFIRWVAAFPVHQQPIDWSFRLEQQVEDYHSWTIAVRGFQ